MSHYKNSSNHHHQQQQNNNGAQFQHHNNTYQQQTPYHMDAGNLIHYPNEFSIGNSWNPSTEFVGSSSGHQAGGRAGPTRERYLHALSSHSPTPSPQSQTSRQNQQQQEQKQKQQVVAYRYNPYAVTAENTWIRCSPSSTPGSCDFHHPTTSGGETNMDMDKMFFSPPSSGFFSPEESRLGTPGGERGGVAGLSSSSGHQQQLQQQNYYGGGYPSSFGVSPSAQPFPVHHSWESHCVLSSVPSSMSIRSQQHNNNNSLTAAAGGQSAVLSPMMAPPSRGPQTTISNMSIVTYKSALRSRGTSSAHQHHNHHSKSGGLVSPMPCAPLAIGIVDRDNTEPLSDDLLGPRVESTYTSRRGSSASVTLSFALGRHETSPPAGGDADEGRENDDDNNNHHQHGSDAPPPAPVNLLLLESDALSSSHGSSNSTTDIVHHQELFDRPEDISYYSFSDPEAVQYLQGLVAKHLYPPGTPSSQIQLVTTSNPSATLAVAPAQTEELFMGQLSENGTMAAAALIAEKVHAPIFRVGPIWGANRVTKAREWKRCATLHVDPKHVDAFVACNRNFVCCDENGLFVAKTEAGAALMEEHTLMERGLGVPLTSVSLRKSTPLPPRKQGGRRLNHQ